MVGFRTFIKNIADSLNITGFVENLADGSVRVVCEGEEGGIKELIKAIKEKTPSFARIDEVRAEYGDYKGEFTSFERRGEDVPKEEKEDAMLRYMRSLDKKGEVAIGILSSMNETLMSVKEDTKLIPSIKENTEKMLEKQDSMLEKQDRTIEILGDVKGDTKYIPSVKADTSKMLEKQDKTIDVLEDIKGDTGEITNALTFLKEIHRETLELRDKYELLSRDVDEIKVKLKAG